MTAPGLATRRAEAADLPAILGLAHRVLGWEGDDADAAFFRWKHFENPFGESPMWVAVDDDRVVGFRTFLRWEFRGHDGALVRAVRAVDTATDPDYQGRGIFTRLTLGAVDDLRDDGVDLIFNTPNERSLPGYLKMGWEIVGRVSTAVMPTRISSFAALARARHPAGQWSIETSVAEPAAAVFSDRPALAALLDAVAEPAGMATRRTPEYLAWRYGFDRLHYRVEMATSSPSDGLVVFRLRPRGGAVEAAVCDVFLPEPNRRVARRLFRSVARATGADYLIRLHAPLMASGPFVRVPRAGPILTSRTLGDRPAPRLGAWALSLGDIELL